MADSDVWQQVLGAAAWNRDAVLRGRDDGSAQDGGGRAQPPVLAYDVGAWLRRAVRPQPCDDVLVRLDVERAEAEALQSLRGAGVLPLVDHLVVGWHDGLLPQVTTARPGLEEALRAEGLEYRYATAGQDADRRYLPGEPCPASRCDSHYMQAREV